MTFTLTDANLPVIRSGYIHTQLNIIPNGIMGPGDCKMPDISINAADGSGSFSAYCATPTSGSGPGIVALQEIFGVNQVMRDLCDGFASALG